MKPGQPFYKTLDIRDIVIFKQKYTRYCDILDLGWRKGAGPSAYPQSVITTVEPNLLSVILKHLMKIEKNQLTDDVFLVWLDSYMEKDTSTHWEIPSLMASDLKLNIKFKPQARIIEFVQKMDQLI